VIADTAECEMRLGSLTNARVHAVEAMRRYAELEMPTEELRASWTLAHVTLQEGQLDEALREFQRIADAYTALGMRAEAGEVLLDSVETYIQRQDWSAALPLARVLTGLFTSIDAPVHAARAYSFLQNSVAAQRATLELIDYIRSYVAAPSGAGLIFSPP
jgi:hypothetical protein